MENNGSKDLPDVNIFWTGGLDSSYRMIQLSKFDVTIQPYYFSDRSRRSKNHEMSAIEAITEDILRHPETRCRILPLAGMKVREVPADEEIFKAHKRLQEVTFIGIQYEWLSRFSKSVEGIELCLEAEPRNRNVTRGATFCVHKYGELRRVVDGKPTPYYILDRERSSEDLVKVFGSFRFPIIDRTKMEMVLDYKELGFETSIPKTWFCHKPIGKEPCGRCVTCVPSIEAGMEFRFTEKGLERYKYRTGWLYLLFKLGVLDLILDLLCRVGMRDFAEMIRARIR